ncbi:PQQ-dependent sugar dehydrogenase [Taibaiella lutea]|nr:PQQ-dependent sugar dehydrogenase [Taibaiella lutea]
MIHLDFNFYRPFRTVLLLSFFVGAVSKTDAQPVLSLTPVISTGLNQPMQFVNAGDGSNRIFIPQKGGTIRVYDATFNYLSDFLTVAPIDANGERGLLSMAFHPNYSTNGLFYVYYTTTAGDLELARYQVSSGNTNVADPASKVVLITIPHPTNTNHNGGELHFGSDGYLYLSTGDGGGGGDVPNNAQSTTVLLGKMLRFNVNTSATAPYYTIPPGNPYSNEIYDLGLRNPYRWSFDRLTGDMWIGDVGQDSWEEFNFRASAATANVNYGWRCYEGNATYNTTGCAPASSYVFPAYTYASQNPSASVTGGVVYRGTAWPLLQGWYIGADFYSGIFYKILPDGLGGWNVSTQTIAPTGIVDFGETENGEAYAVSLTGNSVFNIGSSTVLPLSLISFTATAERNGTELNWKTAREENLIQFDIEYSMDGNAFRYLNTVMAKNSVTGSKYSFNHNIAYSGSIFYRLKMKDKDGSFSYSGTVQVKMDNAAAGIITPNFITDGMLHLDFKGVNNYHTLELLSMDGKVIMKESIAGATNNIDFDISNLSAGLYLTRLSGAGSSHVQKIFVQ